MHALPFLLALAIAAALAPAVLGLLRRAGSERPNFRGHELPFPSGVLVLAAATLALVPIALVQRLAPAALLHPELAPAALYAFGVLALGLVDDLLAPDDGPRGVRAHAAALAGGQLSTGALKAAGSVGLALLASAYLGLSDARWLLASAVLVLATHAFNLLDVRPGRTLKAFALLGAGLAVGTRELRPLWTLGVLAAPALVAGAYDLRERALLGDTGASVIGALAGLWIVLSLSGLGQLLALAALLAIAIVGELRSLSALIERTPGLRQLDSVGRPS